jgi:hypothetical protein
MVMGSLAIARGKILQLWAVAGIELDRMMRARAVAWPGEGKDGHIAIAQRKDAWGTDGDRWLGHGGGRILLLQDVISFKDDGGPFCGLAAGDGRKKAKIAQRCFTIWKIT